MKTPIQKIKIWIDNEVTLGFLDVKYSERLKWYIYNYFLEKEKEQIGQFMNWFIKHYSTATIDGMFGWVNSMDEEVTLKEILEEYYNQTYNQNK